MVGENDGERCFRHPRVIACAQTSIRELSNRARAMEELVERHDKAGSVPTPKPAWAYRAGEEDFAGDAKLLAVELRRAAQLIRSRVPEHERLEPQRENE